MLKIGKMVSRVFVIENRSFLYICTEWGKSDITKQIRNVKHD